MQEVKSDTVLSQADDRWKLIFHGFIREVKSCTALGRRRAKFSLLGLGKGLLGRLVRKAFRATVEREEDEALKDARQREIRELADDIRAVRKKFPELPTPTVVGVFQRVGHLSEEIAEAFELIEKEEAGHGEETN